MAWFEDWFDSDAYEVVYRQRDLADAERLIDLIERAARPDPGSRILDVACGRGRHARLLARRGYQVTGIDLSPNAIALARRRATAEYVEVDFQVADMRALPFDGEFDGAVNLFTSFGYFETDDEHSEAIGQMARALTPGGWLLQDFLNAPHAAKHLVPDDERTTDAGDLGEVILRQQRWIDDDGTGRRIRKRIELCCFDHAPGEPDTHVFHESVRLLKRTDFEKMYSEHGLEIEHAFGDYTGAKYGEDSPRLILLARRLG